MWQCVHIWLLKISICIVKKSRFNKASRFEKGKVKVDFDWYITSRNYSKSIPWKRNCRPKRSRTRRFFPEAFENRLRRKVHSFSLQSFNRKFHTVHAILSTSLCYARKICVDAYFSFIAFFCNILRFLIARDAIATSLM